MPPGFVRRALYLSQPINPFKERRRTMNNLVYPRERTLDTITLVIGVLVWLGLIVGGFGGALFALVVGFLLVQVAQFALIAHVKGKGIELSEARFPDLHAQVIACCERLQMEMPPKVYILNGNGAFNAFATTIPGARFVVLKPGVLAAMGKHLDRVRFYIGHELGRLRMQHLGGALLRWPAMWLPLLGAAYSRARETTCDRHGLACSGSSEGAARALAALSAGPLRRKSLDTTSGSQAKHASRFWVSFHELTAGSSRLSRRVARLMNTEASLPGRDRFAYLLAMFVPYVGRLGVRFGALIMVCIVVVTAAVAVTAYHDHTVKAEVSRAVADSGPVRDALASFYQTYQHVPGSLEAAGIPTKLADDTPLSLDPKTMALTVGLKEGELVFAPGIDKKDHITWECKNGNGIKPTQLPANCSGMTIGSN
jgi:Zn-dependent protease with chaperone function